MIVYKLPRFLLPLLYPITALAQCPDYASVINTPTFVAPQQSKFQHRKSQILAKSQTAWHMVGDTIIQQGQTAAIIAKFDYGAAMHKDLEDEYVDVYLAGTGLTDWKSLGRFKTDEDGRISIQQENLPIGEYRIRFVVEGDLSTVDGYISVVEQGRQAIVFDVDGTLTINDFEAYADYIGMKTARPYVDAVKVVRAYQEKGYQIVYLTARPAWDTKDSRQWFAKMGLPQWHYRSRLYDANSKIPGIQTHKTHYLNYLRNTVGLDIVRVYGNALTDIAAYADSGIAKNQTYIIGTYAGVKDTQAINKNYSEHYQTVVKDTLQSISCK
jgi:phosphatidate phosphatase PAH1